MDAVDIVFKLKRKGLSLQFLAESLGVTVGAVSNAIHQKSRSRRIALAVADAIEAEIDTVFPGLYDSQTTKTRKISASKAEMVRNRKP